MASAEGLRRSVKGLSEIELRERFGTEEACRKALFDMRWREGLACPACGHRGLCALKTRKLFQCNRCKKQVRLTAGAGRVNETWPPCASECWPPFGSARAFRWVGRLERSP